MRLSLHFAMAPLVLVLVAGASAGAQAHTPVQGQMDQSRQAHGPNQVQAQHGYSPEAYGGRYRHAGPAHAACGAPRWDPRVRYMPGQVVWRKGELWAARGISARVYNENSPPEWTPRYWVQAVCR